MDFRLDEPAWAQLDRERPGKPFTVRAGGKVLRFRAAPDVPAGVLIRVTADWRLFLGYCIDDTATLVDADFQWWKAEHMLRLYRHHHGLCTTPQEDMRLFTLLEQGDYRDAIEADLQEIYGVDLGELWRARRWRKLLGMIERLRRSTHFGEATAADEKLAEFVLRKERDRNGEELPPTRRMSEFTVEAELLSVVADRLAELVQVGVASRGGRPRQVKPMPRPKTAVEKLRSEQTQLSVSFTLDRIFGRVDEAGNPVLTPR